MSGFDSLRSLLDRYGPALKLYARQWCHAPDDAVQEALLKLVQQRRLPDPIAPWLFRVVRNEAISVSRSDQRRHRRELHVASCESWFGRGDDELDGQTATSALESLPGEIREVVVARIWGQLTLAQIAEITGVSMSTVHRRYEEGLTQLRERLGVKWRQD